MSRRLVDAVFATLTRAGVDVTLFDSAPAAASSGYFRRIR